MFTTAFNPHSHAVMKVVSVPSSDCITQPSDRSIVLKGRLSLEALKTAQCSDIWGFTSRSTGHEFAIIGCRPYATSAGKTGAIKFVNVTEASSPRLVYEHGEWDSTWYDMRTYQPDKTRAFAYAVSEADVAQQCCSQASPCQRFASRVSCRLRSVTESCGDSGFAQDCPDFCDDCTTPPSTINVYDISRIDAGIVQFQKENLHDAQTEGSGATHNVAIDEAAGRLYRCVERGSTTPKALIIYDIKSDPNKPRVIGSYTDGSGVHDAFVTTPKTGEFAGKHLVYAFMPGRKSIDVLDATDPEKVELLSTTTYEGASYPHQGWIDDRTGLLYTNDEAYSADGDSTTSTVLVFDANPRNLKFLRKYTNGQLAVTHNMFVKDGLVYQANYNSGVRVFRPEGTALEEIASYDTHITTGLSFQGLWGVFPFFPSGRFVGSDINCGLYIWELTPDVIGYPPSPSPASVLPPPPTPAPSPAASPPPLGEDFLDVRYGSGDGQLLDVYLSGKRIAPIVCYIHGSGRTKEDIGFNSREALKDKLLLNDHHVCSINYDGGRTKTVSEMYDEIDAALSFIDSTCADYGVCGQPKVLVGESLGGLMAAWQGVACPQRVTAVVNVYGATNLDLFGADQLGCLDDCEAVKQAQSPLLNVKPCIRTSFIHLHGSLDTRVPVQDSRSFHNELQMQTIDSTLKVRALAGHNWERVVAPDEDEVVQWIVQKTKASPPSPVPPPATSPVPPPTTSTPPSPAPAAYIDIPYGDHPRQKLDLFKSNAASPAPCLIFIHGGGWEGGNKEDITFGGRAELKSTMLNRGIDVASLNYRLNRNDATISDMVDDVERALKFLLNQKQEFRIDIEKIAVLGESAGGHLGSMLGVRLPDALRAVVNVYAPTNIEYYLDVDEDTNADFRRLLGCGSDANVCREEARRVSPLFQVDTGRKYLNFHGALDRLVPVSQALEFQNKLLELDVDSSLDITLLAGHNWERVVKPDDLYDWIEDALTDSS